MATQNFPQFNPFQNASPSAPSRNMDLATLPHKSDQRGRFQVTDQALVPAAPPLNASLPCTISQILPNSHHEIRLLEQDKHLKLNYSTFTMLMWIG